MASKRKPAAAAGSNLGALLASAAAVNQTNVPYYATKDEMAGLLAHPAGQLVEFNESIKDATGKIAFRATPVGLQMHASGALNGAQQPPAQSSWQQPAAASAVPSNAGPAKTFNFKKGIPIPAARRGGRGANTYGFEQMEVGDAFDIVSTADNPQPAKRVASTVSSASKRLAPKSFIVRSIEEAGVKLARVWRTA